MLRLEAGGCDAHSHGPDGLAAPRRRDAAAVDRVVPALAVGAVGGRDARAAARLGDARGLDLGLVVVLLGDTLDVVGLADGDRRSAGLHVDHHAGPLPAARVLDEEAVGAVPIVQVDEVPDLVAQVNIEPVPAAVEVDVVPAADEQLAPAPAVQEAPDPAVQADAAHAQWRVATSQNDRWKHGLSNKLDTGAKQGLAESRDVRLTSAPDSGILHIILTYLTLIAAVFVHR